MKLYIKCLSQILVHYTCTEKNWWLLWLLLWWCHTVWLPLHQAASVLNVKRASCSPYTKWFHQFHSRLLRASPFCATTVSSSSSSCPDSHHQKSPVPGSTRHSLLEPSLVLSLLILPLTTLQGPETFDVHVAACRGRKIKPPLFPLWAIRPLAI